MPTHRLQWWVAHYQTNTYGSHMLTPPGGESAATDIQIAHSITNARLHKSKTVRILSDETGISYPVLCQSLSGDRSLTFSEFERIAHSLEIEPYLLLPDALTESAKG